LHKFVSKSGERRVRVDGSLGKASKTRFKVKEAFEHMTLVEASPITGRTHQIRVHAKHWCAPIVGDDKYGDEVYTNLKDHNQAIQDYLEREEITLSPKNRKALLDPKTWIAQRGLMEEAERLMASIGQDLFDDFNIFKARVDADLKARKVKLAAAQKNQILNAVSWRDEDAAKVVKKVHKLTGSKLDDLLVKLDTTAAELPDHGYWPTSNAGEYIEYEADSDLRDSENVPLKDDIHAYFLREVRPHVKDAWLDISSVKIGYEISFNRYFYQHKPLRGLNEVAHDILELEKETEGLLKRLVSLTDEGAV